VSFCNRFLQRRPREDSSITQKAAAHGYNPNLWFNNVEIIASVEIGRQTVDYVRNIYTYYLTYKMVIARQAKSTEVKEKIEANKSSGL